MSNNITPIFGRLKNVTKENPYVAGAVDIKDDSKNKDQQTINQETDEHLGEHDTEIADRYTKEEVNNIVSRTPETDVIVIEVPAASQSDIAGWLDANTPSGTDPETGRSVRANKLYRVPGPDNTTYSEWAWDGTKYIMLANKDYGFDEEPTLDSTNIMQSGHIAKSLGYFVTNYEWVKVIADKNGRTIAGIRRDGSIDWYKGVPVPIKNELLKIRKIIDDEQFIKLCLDSKGHVLWGIRKDGSVEWYKGVPDVLKNYFGKYIFNREYVKLVTDNKGVPLLGIKKDGTVVGNFSVSHNIRTYIDGVLNSLKPDASDVVARNIDKLPALYNACRYYRGSRTKDIQFCIITDTHNVQLSVQNGVRIASSFDTIDALIHCGDITQDSYIPSEAIANMRIMMGCGKPVYITLGNHDVGNTKYLYWSCTHETAYNTFIKPLVDGNYLDTNEYQEGKCYYFHDFKEYKIRLISIYDYDAPLDLEDNEYWEPVTYNASYPLMKPGETYVYSEDNQKYYNCGDYKGHSFRLKKTCTTIPNKDVYNDTFPKYRAGRQSEFISEEQANWFLDTLLSTPEEYGIVVMGHNAFSRNCTNQKQREFADNVDFGGWGQFCSDADFIASAINAWINKEQFSYRYVGGKFYPIAGSTDGVNDCTYLNIHTEDGESYAYEVSKDFSSRAESAYFSCVFGGHMHVDLILKHNDYDIIGIYPTSGTSWSGYALSMVARPENTDSIAFDAITVVSVNKDRLALCRIGNTTTTDAKKRYYEIIK